MLTKKEKTELKKLLKKAKRPEFDAQVFEELVKMVPFIACELVVVNSNKQILLTWREDKYWQGWHFPGGLLRYGETFEKRLKKVARAELGATLKSSKFLFPKNYLINKRSHDVSLIFLCKLKSVPKKGKFFAKIPKDIIPEHKELWKLVRKSI